VVGIRVTGRLNEIEGNMDASVINGASVSLHLQVQIGSVLVLDVLNNWNPT